LKQRAKVHARPLSSIWKNTIRLWHEEVIGMALGDLIDEFNEVKGGAVWETKKRSLFDQNVREVVLVDKIVGTSHFRILRNENFEFVFEHQGPFGKRVLKVDLHQVDYHDGIRIVLGWSPEETVMKVSDTTLDPRAIIVSAS